MIHQAWRLSEYGEDNLGLACTEQGLVLVRDFDGAVWGNLDIQAGQITGRAVQLIVPKGSMTDAQRAIIGWVRQMAKQNNRPVDIIVTEF